MIGDGNRRPTLTRQERARKIRKGVAISDLVDLVDWLGVGHRSGIAAAPATRRPMPLVIGWLKFSGED
jgi:hypothetical protein